MLAGCVTPSGPDASDSALAAARISSQVGSVGGQEPLVWQGRALEFASGPGVPCEPSSCERFAFDLALPDGFWDHHTGALEISIRWPLVEAMNYRQSGFFSLTLRDGDGRLVAEGRGYTAQVILVANAPAGAYEATIMASPGEDDYNEGWKPLHSNSTYEGVVQLEATPNDASTQTSAPQDLLPDLITMRPMSLSIANPNSGGPQDALYDAAHIRGCQDIEVIEAQARRCLRFQNTLANIGEGPFEVRVDDVQGLASVGGQGRFMQRIERSDGTARDAAAGLAAYHLWHEHIHYQDLTRFTVYTHDLATGARGEQVGQGHKYGFCSGDIGLVDLTRLGTRLPNQWAGCGIPTPGGISSMGLSPGWYDAYSASRDEQYVEMVDAPDGVYELVSAVDPDHTAHEADTTNNEASVVFRLTGDEVEVLSGTGLRLD